MDVTTAVVVLVATSISYLQFRAQYQHELQLIQDRLEERGLSLDYHLKIVTNRVKALRSQAESYLAVNGDRPFSSPYNQLQQVPGQNRFAMDHLRLPLTADQVGNLTGLGSLQNRSAEFNLDLNMALSLNPSFQVTKQLIPELSWTYYLSKHQFVNRYPWVPSNQVKFLPQLYTQEFYTATLAQQNPEQQLVWTGVHADIAGKGLVVTAAAPVYLSRTFRGTVAVDLSLDEFNQYVKKLGNHQSHLFLVNAQGQLLAHPTLVQSANSDPQPVETAWPEALQSRADQILQHPSMQMQDVGEYLVIHQNLTNAPWKLVFWIPEAAIIMDLVAKRMVGSLTLLLGLIGIVAFTQWLTRREFVRPAEQLLQHIEQESQIPPNELENSELSKPEIPDWVAPGWRPWFETISHTFADNRRLLRELQQREQRLKQQISQLKIEIDQSKRSREFNEITETDYFQQLEQKAEMIRRKMKDIPKDQ